MCIVHSEASGLQSRSSVQERSEDLYRRRIQELVDLSIKDGVSLEEASRQHFFRFVSKWDITRRANLVLLESGNLRAIWKDREGSRVALEFLPQGQIGYVLFKGGDFRKPDLQESGRSDLQTTVSTLEKSGLFGLLKN